jgi:hypothetical protein
VSSSRDSQLRIGLQRYAAALDLLQLLARAAGLGGGLGGLGGGGVQLPIQPLQMLLQVVQLGLQRPQGLAPAGEVGLQALDGGGGGLAGAERAGLLHPPAGDPGGGDALAQQPGALGGPGGLLPGPAGPGAQLGGGGLRAGGGLAAGGGLGLQGLRPVGQGGPGGLRGLGQLLAQGGALIQAVVQLAPQLAGPALGGQRVAQRHGGLVDPGLVAGLGQGGVGAAGLGPRLLQGQLRGAGAQGGDPGPAALGLSAQPIGGRAVLLAPVADPLQLLAQPAQPVPIPPLQSVQGAPGAGGLCAQRGALVGGLDQRRQPLPQPGDQGLLGQQLALAADQLLAEGAHIAADLLAQLGVDRELEEEVDEVLGAGEAEQLVGAALPLVHADLVGEDARIQSADLQQPLPLPLALGGDHHPRGQRGAQLGPGLAEGGQSPAGGPLIGVEVDRQALQGRAGGALGDPGGEEQPAQRASVGAAGPVLVEDAGHQAPGRLAIPVVGVEQPLRGRHRPIARQHIVLQPALAAVGLAAEELPAVGAHDGEEQVEQAGLAAAVAQPEGGVGGPAVAAAQIEQQVLHPGLGVAHGDEAHAGEVGHQRFSSGARAAWTSR